MEVNSIKLRNFRNYPDLELELNKNVNVFVGKNGQGKSNLVESIYFGLTGESFRIHDKHDLIHKGFDFSEVEIHTEDKKILRNVNIKIHENKISAVINNKKKGIAELKRLHPVIVFSPDSLLVFKQGPGEKRNFFDDIFSSISQEHSVHVSDYKKCLKVRNRVFKMHLAGEISRQEALRILESLEFNFLKSSVDLVNSRLNLLREIITPTRTTMADILRKENVDISVDYIISKQSAIAWSKNQVYDALKSRLQELHDAELSSGMSLVGPHKHDFKIFLNEYDVQCFGSQGQQRAVVLSFKLAQLFERKKIFGDYPILILDDVLSELDVDNRKNVAETLLATKAQIFITTTDFESVTEVGSLENFKIVKIEEGKVTPGWK